MNKGEVYRNATFFAISLGGIVYIYGKKYFLLSTFFTLGIAYGIAQGIKKAMQKENAGGTTPYNPLKIPAKKITPIH